MQKWTDFSNYWVCDFEFQSNGGDIPQPFCYVAKNLQTEKIIKRWLRRNEKPEYPIDTKHLFIAFFASAELGCHYALNFAIPPYILDLFTEFRCLTNGQKIPGNSLINACDYFKVKSEDSSYKDTMRNRILEGPPFTNQEKKDILDYCQKDVEMTAQLFQRMKDHIELPYALLRGRYMSAIAYMEHIGIPIDVTKLNQLKNNWDWIKTELIAEVDRDYDVFEGNVFKTHKFDDYLKRNNISWECTPKGNLKLDNTYFSNQAKAYPELKSLQELRYTLGKLRLTNLQVGEDGRNRCLLSPFQAITSRNQPSSNRYIFGPSIWMRNLIAPTEGNALAYIDYEQQEIAIAGALSKDYALLEAYDSGDPYLAFAKSAGAIPPDGTKERHPEIREKYKILMLAIGYGMAVETFAKQAKIPLDEAKSMMAYHKRKYNRYWEWISNFIDIGLLSGKVHTTYHWQMKTKDSKYRTLQNWPMQSHGADILRLAICMCISHNIKVCGPVHDAILIESSIENIEDDVENAKYYMEKASKYVVGHKIRTEAKIIKYPNHYCDDRGTIWDNIWNILKRKKEYKLYNNIGYNYDSNYILLNNNRDATQEPTIPGSYQPRNLEPQQPRKEGMNNGR
jgi:hypothetical protein